MAKSDVGDVIESATKPARFVMKKLSSAFPLPNSGVLKSRGDGDGLAVAKKNAIKRKMARAPMANDPLNKIKPGATKVSRNPEYDRKQGNR